MEEFKTFNEFAGVPSSIPIEEEEK